MNPPIDIRGLKRYIYDKLTDSDCGASSLYARDKFNVPVTVRICDHCNASGYCGSKGATYAERKRLAGLDLGFTSIKHHKNLFNSLAKALDEL